MSTIKKFLKMIKNIILIILIYISFYNCVPKKLDKDKIIKCIEKNNFEGLNKFKPLIKDKLINLFGYGTNLDFTHKNTNLLVYSFKKNCSLDIVKFLVEIAKITNLNACGGHNFNLGGIRVAIAYSNPEVLDYLFKKFPNEFYETLNYEITLNKQFEKFKYNTKTKEYDNQDLLWQNIFSIPRYKKSDTFYDKSNKLYEYSYYLKLKNIEYIFNLNKKIKYKQNSININLDIPIEILIPSITLHLWEFRPKTDIIKLWFDLIYSKTKCKKTLATYFILWCIFRNQNWFVIDYILKNKEKQNSTYEEEQKENIDFHNMENNFLKYDFYFYDVFFGALYLGCYNLATEVLKFYLPYLENYDYILEALIELIYDCDVKKPEDRNFYHKYVMKDTKILQNLIKTIKKKIFKKTYWITSDYAYFWFNDYLVEINDNGCRNYIKNKECSKIKNVNKILEILCASDLKCSKNKIESFINKINNNDIDCDRCSSNKLLLIKPLLDKYLNLKKFSIDFYLDTSIDTKYRKFYTLHYDNDHFLYLCQKFEKFSNTKIDNLQEKLLDIILKLITIYDNNRENKKSIEPYGTDLEKLILLEPLLFKYLDLQKISISKIKNNNHENEEEKDEEIDEGDKKFEQSNFKKFFDIILKSIKGLLPIKKNDKMFIITLELLKSINKNFITSQMIIDNKIFKCKNTLDLFYKYGADISSQKILDAIYIDKKANYNAVIIFLIDFLDKSNDNINKILQIIFTKNCNSNINIDQDLISLLKNLLQKNLKIDKKFILSEILESMNLRVTEHELFFIDTYKIIDIFLHQNIEEFNLQDLLLYTSLGYIYTSDDRFYKLFKRIIVLNIIVGHEFKYLILKFIEQQSNDKQRTNARIIMNEIDIHSNNMSLITINNLQEDPENRKNIKKLFKKNLETEKSIKKIEKKIKNQNNIIDEYVNSKIEKENQTREKKINDLKNEISNLDNQLSSFKNQFNNGSYQPHKYDNEIKEIISQNQIEKKIYFKTQQIMGNKILAEFYSFFQIYTNNILLAFRVISTNYVEQNFSFLTDQTIETMSEYGAKLSEKIIKKLNLPFTSMISDFLKEMIHRLKKNELNNISQYFINTLDQCKAIEILARKFINANEEKILKLNEQSLTTFEKAKKIKNIILGENIKTKIKFFIKQCAEDFIKILKKKEIGNFKISDQFQQKDIDILLNYLTEKSKIYLINIDQSDQKEEIENIQKNIYTLNTKQNSDQKKIYSKNNSKERLDILDTAEKTKQNIKPNIIKEKITFMEKEIAYLQSQNDKLNSSHSLLTKQINHLKKMNENQSQKIQKLERMVIELLNQKK